MNRQLFSLKLLSATIALSFAASAAEAQRLVVSHDEWLTGTGTFNADEQSFLTNVLGWFGVGAGNSALIYSSDAFITNAGFTNFLTGKGISSTLNADAGSFAGFQVVFVERNATMNSAALATYVQSGGNVLYFGGAGPDPVTEAANSNPFLNAFGFNFADSYNGLGTVNTSGFAAQGQWGASIFTGVSSIFAINGNNITLTVPATNVSSQLFSDNAGNGVFGAAAYLGATTAPEPATVVLVALGLFVVAPLVRRARGRQRRQTRYLSLQRTNARPFVAG